MTFDFLYQLLHFPNLFHPYTIWKFMHTLLDIHKIYICVYDIVKPYIDVGHNYDVYLCITIHT